MELKSAAQTALCKLLETRTGQRFAENRTWRLESALSAVLRDNAMKGIDDLVVKLKEPGAHQLENDVIEALINNETYFFRDKTTFDQLPHTILPLLAKRREDRKSLHVWSAGCSTGQEVYSLAINFADNTRFWSDWAIDILGTDISSNAIHAARKGTYSQFEVQRGLGIMHILRYFEETPTGWAVNNQLGRNIRFEKHNVLTSPPCKRRFDLILCRNVLLYFDDERKMQIVNSLHKAIAPDGFLMLGAGETTAIRSEFFESYKGMPSLFTPRAAQA